MAHSRRPWRGWCFASAVREGRVIREIHLLAASHSHEGFGGLVEEDAPRVQLRRQVSFAMAIIWNLRCFTLSESLSFCSYSILDVDQKASLTSQKLMDLGWEPRTLEETLSDSVECYKKAGALQDVPGRPCRLPHLFRLAGDQWINCRGSVSFWLLIHFVIKTLLSLFRIKKWSK